MSAAPGRSVRPSRRVTTSPSAIGSPSAPSRRTLAGVALRASAIRKVPPAGEVIHLSAERDDLDAMALGEQVLVLGHRGPGPDAEHGLDPGRIAALARSETAATLGIEHRRDPGRPDARPVGQAHQGVGLLQRRGAERIRRHRIAVRPQHHQDAVLDHGPHQAEVEAPLARFRRRADCEAGPFRLPGRGRAARGSRGIVCGRSHSHGVSPAARSVAAQRCERAWITLADRA
jgi:hypothetical protein